jgi:hypothetical protein
MINKLIFSVLIAVAVTSPALAERTRDIVIRDFNKGVSRLTLSDEQQKKWDAVISSVFHLHEKLGGWGKYSKAQSPWIQYPGHWYVTTNQNETPGKLIAKYVDIQVEDYRRVVKAHIEIHERLEEFDDSLDPDTRKKFRGHFRDVWAWVYDNMTDQIEKMLSKEIADVRSQLLGLKPTKEQRIDIDALLAKLDEARKDTIRTKNQGRKDLWTVMSSPEIPWSQSPMMCKSYFESFALTMKAYADVISGAEGILDEQQKLQLQKLVISKYKKELDFLVTQKI